MEIKTKLKKLYYRLLSSITFGNVRQTYLSKLYYKIQGQNNQLYLQDADNKRYDFSKSRFRNLNLEINGNNNIVILPKETLENGKLRGNISIKSDNNELYMAQDVKGNWNITLYHGHNYMKVGQNTDAGGFSISLHGNHLEIGQDCMISALEELWTDGHSVIDASTKELLNAPKDPILIGNHVWLGRRCTLTKGAQIPDGCIVGIDSVVTKKFIEPNCLIAGNPAQVRKKGITWDGTPPTRYTHNNSGE